MSKPIHEIPKTHDIDGRPYAKLSELKAGDKVELYDGFDCHAPGIVELEVDANGRLFFFCVEQDTGMNDAQHHYIDGQADDGEHCVGVYRP